MILTIQTIDDAERYLAKIDASTRATFEALAGLRHDPVEGLMRIKFEKTGRHPVEDRAINFIEQVNQSFTFMVALQAAKLLVEMHPEAGGFELAPGATAALPYDIMSVMTGIVAAETFAAVAPTNNRKLSIDVRKLARCEDVRNRYVFFYSPGFAIGRHTNLETDPRVEVHCVDIGARRLQVFYLFEVTRAVDQIARGRNK